MGQNATPGAGKQSSDVQIRQNSRHAREKKSNDIQTGHEIPSVAGQTTGAKYFRKKNP